MTDRMKHGPPSIECRAPLVDYELVEMMSRMPSSLKVRGFTMKYLMKKAVTPWVPREVLERKEARVLAHLWAPGSGRIFGRSFLTCSRKIKFAVADCSDGPRFDN